ncbi:hypothetical protein KIW84_023503 [Lathyrus oleraceus]|uniref:Uncharacterized protein n=1 Tax=Pisum sativum TaxID=3888 RepID=A0A9D4YEC3_PEA|nr:hypothetical protein KIW84_023503 [Pisum sativum]
MVGRNDYAIAGAFIALAQLLQAQQNPQVEGVKPRGLDRFLRNKPPTFKGRYDLEVAQVWLQEIDKILRVMTCADAQKILYGTYIMSEEAEYWWDNARQRFEANGCLP